MSINRLRAFVAVAETGSITAAADVLGRSAPALSRQLRKLEEEMGRTLLEPDGRGIRLTEQGRAFASRAQRVLEEYRTLVALGEQEQPHALRIASFEVFTTYALGAVAAGPLKDVQLTIVSSIPGEVEDAVAEGIADIGLTYTPAPVTGVEHVEVGRVDMVVAQRRDAPFAKVPVGEVPFAVPARLAGGVVTENLNADGWPMRLPRRVAYRVNAMESALELARRGLAAVYVPSFVIDLHDEQVRPAFQLSYASLPDPHSYPVFMAVASARASDPLVHRATSAFGALLDRPAR